MFHSGRVVSVLLTRQSVSWPVGRFHSSAAVGIAGCTCACAQHSPPSYSLSGNRPRVGAAALGSSGSITLFRVLIVLPNGGNMSTHPYSLARTAETVRQPVLPVAVCFRSGDNPLRVLDHDRRSVLEVCDHYHYSVAVAAVVLTSADSLLPAKCLGCSGCCFGTRP
jgi:hypothetical protein